MWVHVMPEELYYACGTWNGLAQLVEALRYKVEGRGSIPDGVIGIFR